MDISTKTTSSCALSKGDFFCYPQGRVSSSKSFVTRSLIGQLNFSSPGSSVFVETTLGFLSPGSSVAIKRASSHAFQRPTLFLIPGVECLRENSFVSRSLKEQLVCYPRVDGIHQNSFVPRLKERPVSLLTGIQIACIKFRKRHRRVFSQLDLLVCFVTQRYVYKLC